MTPQIYVSFVIAAILSLQTLEVVSAESRRLVIEGTSGMSYITDWAASFARSNKIGVSVRVTNSAQAVKCVIDRTCDIGMASEEENGIKDGNLLLTPFGLGGAVIVVSKDVPLESLGLDQAKRIFSGQIKNWRELGGPDQPVKVWRRREESGLHKSFAKFIPVASHLEVIHKMKLLEARIKSEKGVIAYYNIAVARSEKSLPFKILKLDGISPTAENLRNGKYPLVQRSYLLRLKSRADDPLVNRLVDHLLSERKEHMETLGLTPF